MPKQPKQVTNLMHPEAKRANIPTAEYQSVLAEATKAPVKVRYPRGGPGLADEKAARNPDLDPQLVWRGKDQQDWSDLVVNAPPLYIQEKVKPKVLIDDLLRYHPSPGGRGAGSKLRSPSGRGVGGEGPDSPDAGNYEQINLFADFNGLPDGADKTGFYRYQGNWQNRVTLSDSLPTALASAEPAGATAESSLASRRRAVQ